tara:strand:- start:262 stop:420 length:159 start_codon:yes stop_codon:yes gene_type:complete
VAFALRWLVIADAINDISDKGLRTILSLPASTTITFIHLLPVLTIIAIRVCS